MVRSSLEISAVLRLLQRTGSLLSVHPDGGEEFFLSSVVRVDAERGWLSIEAAAAAASNQLARLASSSTLVGICERIKVQFDVGAWTPAHDGSQDCLQARMPTSLLRLQRREYYRVDVPQTTPLRCHIPAQPPLTRETLQARIVDISGGGIAMVEGLGAQVFPVGTRLQGCSIELPGAMDVRVDLLVRASQAVPGRQDQVRWVSGCEFVDLPEPVRAQMQRLISRLEREQLRRATRS